MRIPRLAWDWLTTSAHWAGPEGIGARLAEHLGYAGLALLIAAAIGIPLGLLIGHTRRGGFLLVNVANAARALPTVGIMMLVVTLASGLGLLPVLASLVALAVPPILVNTYSGISQVEATLVDASRCMGMREHQVLRQVEIPLALPLILLGLRTAAIQIVATATVAAYVGLGGLGRFIVDGLARHEYDTVVGGSLIVVALALITQGAFTALRKILIPKRT